MSDLTLIVQKLVETGFHFSMDTKNLSLLVTKLIVLSLKFVDKQKLWASLFEQSDLNHVDWSLLKPEYNAFSDLYYWIPLIMHCSWEGIERIVDQHLILQHIQHALVEAGISSEDYTFMCQLLILHLLEKMSVLGAFEHLISHKMKGSVNHVSAVLLANISNKLFKPEDYETTLCSVLSDTHMRVNVKPLQDKLSMLESQRESIVNLNIQFKKDAYVSSRPRLRDLLDFSASDKVQMDTRLGTWESYVCFCQLHQFPNILNEVSKQKLYFHASQTRWNWKEHLHHVIGPQEEMIQKLSDYPVSKPDLEVLHACIQRMNMNGRPPFTELVLFKNKCFVNYPLTLFSTINLTQFLRLYVCVYQNESVWKELWKMQKMLFSPQVVKDCEKFVNEFVFNVDEFLKFF